jgi:hypothetical protein
MRPVETIPGLGEGWIKENGRGGEFNYDILYPQYKHLKKSILNVVNFHAILLAKLCILLMFHIHKMNAS